MKVIPALLIENMKGTKVSDCYFLCSRAASQIFNENKFQILSKVNLIKIYHRFSEEKQTLDIDIVCGEKISIILCRSISNVVE